VRGEKKEGRAVLQIKDVAQTEIPASYVMVNKQEATQTAAAVGHVRTSAPSIPQDFFSRPIPGSSLFPLPSVICELRNIYFLQTSRTTTPFHFTSITLHTPQSTSSAISRL
jgi:hypothetical protein